MIKRNDWMWVQYRTGVPFMPELSQATLTRLLYLATYTDNNGVVVKYDEKYGIKYRIKSNELPNMLGLTPRRCGDFIRELKDHNMIIMNKNGCELKTDMIFNSRTKEHKIAGCQLAHINKIAVRALYEQVEVHEHKMLGVLFKMISFIHPKTNMLCENPFEEYDDNVKSLSLKQYCVKLGYHTSNTARVCNQFYDLVLVSSDDKEYCPIELSQNKKQAFISPLLFRTKIDD